MFIEQGNTDMDAASTFKKAPIFRLNMLRVIKTGDMKSAGWWATKEAEIRKPAFSPLPISTK